MNNPPPIGAGEAVIDAVCRAKAMEQAIVGESGTIFVWAANAAEQIEAALAEAGWHLSHEPPTNEKGEEPDAAACSESSCDLADLLDGEPKPTKKQFAWVLRHLANSFESGKTFSRVMQDAYGPASKEAVWCSNVGQYVNNALQCCRDTPEAMGKFNGCQT